MGSNHCAKESPFHKEGANHRECTGLPCGSTGKRDKAYSRSSERRELQPLVPGAAKVAQKGRSKAQPAEGSNPEQDRDLLKQIHKSTHLRFESIAIHSDQL